MISAETRVQIRHLFFAEHWKIGTIARQLQIHPDAVRHAIESDRFNRAQAHLGYQSHFMGYRILSYGVPISPYAYTDTAKLLYLKTNYIHQHSLRIRDTCGMSQ